MGDAPLLRADARPGARRSRPAHRVGALRCDSPPTPRPGRPARARAPTPAPARPAGAQHIVFLTESGRLYSYGKGTALALPKAERKSWELVDVSKHALDERKVLQVAAGSNSTAIIVEA